MITMYFENKFKEASFKERLYFDRLIEEHNLFPSDKWTYYKTPYLGNDDYDYMATNIKTGKKLLIEIKLRDNNWGNYVYETKKHKALMDIKKNDPDNITIIYVNSTPSGSYFWNIDDIISKYKSTKMVMNKSTMASKSDKKTKSVYLLDTNDAFKRIQFRYLDKFMIEYEMLEKQKNRQKKIRCIFDD